MGLKLVKAGIVIANIWCSGLWHPGSLPYFSRGGTEWCCDGSSKIFILKVVNRANRLLIRIFFWGDVARFSLQLLLLLKILDLLHFLCDIRHLLILSFHFFFFNVLNDYVLFFVGLKCQILTNSRFACPREHQQISSGLLVVLFDSEYHLLKKLR